MFAEKLIGALTTFSDKVLMSDQKTSLTGSDINRMSYGIARHLTSVGVVPGTRIGIANRDQIASFLCFIAAIRIGAVPGFIDFRFKPDMKAQLIDRFGLSLMLDASAKLDYHANALRFDPAWMTEAVEDPDPEEQLPEESAYLLVSSGTTGMPKAYVQSEANLQARLFGRFELNIADHNTLLIASPLSFAATHSQLMTGFIGGLHIRFFPIMHSPAQLAEALADKDVTYTYMPPPILFRLLEEVGDRDTPAFPNIKHLKTGGDNVPPDLAQSSYRKLSPHLRVTFGSSSAGKIAILEGEAIFTHADSAGKVFEGGHIEVLDPVTREPLPVGQEGLLRMHSPEVVWEIIGGENSDEQAGPGWCITGDVGYVTEDNYVYVTGRLGDVVMRGGVSVSPVDVENKLRAIPGVEDIAVSSIPDPRLGQELVALFIAPGLSEAELRSEIMTRVDQDKRPRIIHLVDKLPYTPNGKLDRKAIRADLQSQID